MKKIIQEYKDLSPGVKASIAYFIANVVTAGISYITTPVYTRLLTATEYGQVSIFLTWKQVFGIVAMFCLSYGVFNNGMSDFPDRRDCYSFSMLILSNIITLIFAFILLLTTHLLSVSWLNIDSSLLGLMCITFFFQPAYNFFIVKQRYELKYKSTVIWTIICAFLSPVVALICMYFSSINKVYARLFGSEGTLIIIYMFFWGYIGYKSNWKLNCKYWKNALVFNIPLIPHYLSTYILSGSDKIMISILVGDTATAYYSVAYSVAMVATIVWSSVNASLVPYTYENCKKKNYKAISNVISPVLIIFATICILVMMMAPEIIAFMATSDYKEAIYVIPPIVGGVFFQVQYYIYANILYYYKKPKYVMFASISAALLNLILNYIFINKYGYIAAGYTTLFCYLLQAIIDYYAMKHVVNTKIYDMKCIFILSIFLLLTALVSNILYQNLLVRYFVVVILICSCIVFRKKIISTLDLIHKKG